MAKMWSGRFEQRQSKLLDEFNASIMFDKKLYLEDINGSIAHSKMLGVQEILNENEAQAIKKGLAQVKEEISSQI